MILIHCNKKDFKKNFEEEFYNYVFEIQNLALYKLCNKKVARIFAEKIENIKKSKENYNYKAFMAHKLSIELFCYWIKQLIDGENQLFNEISIFQNKNEEISNNIKELQSYVNNTIDNLQEIKFSEEVILYNLENDLYDKFIDFILQTYKNKLENIKEKSSKESSNLKKNISDIESERKKCKNISDKKNQFQSLFLKIMYES